MLIHLCFVYSCLCAIQQSEIIVMKPWVFILAPLQKILVILGIR